MNKCPKCNSRVILRRGEKISYLFKFFYDHLQQEHIHDPSIRIDQYVCLNDHKIRCEYRIGCKYGDYNGVNTINVINVK